MTKKEARVELQKKIGTGGFVSIGRAFGSNFDKETFAMDATCFKEKSMTLIPITPISLASYLKKKQFKSISILEHE